MSQSEQSMSSFSLSGLNSILKISEKILVPKLHLVHFYNQAFIAEATK
ncbi:hypothetical protein LCGC14_1561560 [marine sediment metagenome]|jgi:hypothetical protein|uniref:Uncharacterized protein n=1 Tax=marine sediment metagenome TaxID=412755 RepID=A0A0F9J8C0_9ZZZZ